MDKDTKEIKHVTFDFEEKENEDNIRVPDPVKTEQLLEDDRSNEDIEIETAILLSIKEYEENREKNEEYERKIFEEYETEKKRRQELFKNIMVHLLRLSKYDKEIKDLYDILREIVDAYCELKIETYTLDEITYATMIKILGIIRIDKDIIKLLKEIIIM